MSWVSDLIDMFSAPAAEATDKITAFTVAGTGALDPKTGNANFPAQVAQLLDPAKFTWNAVAYPAAMPFTWSVNQGVSNLGSEIRMTPGKFVIISYSQGAMVASRIRSLLTSGDLSSRNGDFLGAVVMGNPCGMVNAAFPGYSRGNHGIADAGHRLTTTDSRWWEMVIPGDLAADIGDDLTGQWLSLLFMAVWGGSSPKSAVIDTLAAAPVSLTHLLPEFLSYFGLGEVDGAAHTQYDTYIPATINGVTNAKTMVQLAADHINSLAA